MQKNNEIVFPAGTQLVAVSDIPALIAQALYVSLQAKGALLSEATVENIGGQLHYLAGKTYPKLTDDEGELFRNAQLYKQVKEHSAALQSALRGKAGGLAAISRLTGMQYSPQDDIADAYVKIDDFRAYVKKTYPGIDVQIEDNSLSGELTTAKENLPWWQKEPYDILVLAQNIGETLHRNKGKTSNGAIAKEIAKRISLIERREGRTRKVPNWDTIRGVLTGWHFKSEESRKNANKPG
ncbi:hypothetical protein SAMN05216344_11473 [Polaromonas sp. OV174]|uniref:hypothetical protein n=1 Tax=Polaromonas sp. OV174 TaxID=1855300 RepID=UPI0008F35AAF|nr:hypothetical protein [Polaromonas sp. OV174]SFC33597.1 hypothetical protein SAMN05216344_11473 [Polaromonas sp. OV174]